MRGSSPPLQGVRVRGNRVDNPVEAREPDLVIGARIGRYVILERVGNGAMGVVYGAYDPELDRKIALKLLLGVGAGAAPLARARMMREAKAMARLAHPNVATVHDVGVFEERVFLATEFLSGGTVREWLEAAPRTWREVVDVFIAAGRGLAAAHAAGLVHRDFKPDNVLLDKEGRARVVDFGLARNAEIAEAESKSGGGGTLDIVHPGGGAHPPPKYDPNLPTGVDLSPSDKLDRLTRTGALMGTPSYMAPEAFLGEPTDERSDQFSFCVALYEALYGQRPFEGDSLVALSVSVTSGHLRPLPKDRDVPAWVRRAVLRGLRLKRDDRYPSMLALIAALEDDPAIKRRRRSTLAGVGMVAIVAAIVVLQIGQRRRAELERRIAEQVQHGEQDARAATEQVTRLRELRARAFTAFDAMDREGGESLWRTARALVPELLETYKRAERELEAALELDGARDGVRSELADVLAGHIKLGDELHVDEDLSGLPEQLAANEVRGGTHRLVGPVAVELRVSPPDAALSLERHYRDEAARRGQWTPLEGKPARGATSMTLETGSYRIVARAPGHADTIVPFELRRGDAATRTLEVTLPPTEAVPTEMVYVPSGESWFGDADEQLRTQFLGAVPIHKRAVAAFLIARDETTYADWIAFLEAMPASERARHLPDAATTSHGSVSLRPNGAGWVFTLQSGAAHYVAHAGEPFVYNGRRRMARQDWSRFPVAGVSVADVEAYLEWLRRTRRVPGARLCDEVEWERAARGADDRLFPNGDELQPDDANFDVTYGRVASAYGPDAVGSHPGSRSPFGVDDLAGNVLEFAISSQARDEFVIRGGAYFFNSVSSRSTNREPVPRTLRDATTGVRVCATFGERR
jgi:formylglycine-generating enzyme required for sulfatase activity